MERLDDPQQEQKEDDPIVYPIIVYELPPFAHLLEGPSPDPYVDQRLLSVPFGSDGSTAGSSLVTRDSSGEWTYPYSRCGEIQGTLSGSVLSSTSWYPSADVMEGGIIPRSSLDWLAGQIRMEDFSPTLCLGRPSTPPSITIGYNNNGESSSNLQVEFQFEPTPQIHLRKGQNEYILPVSDKPAHWSGFGLLLQEVYAPWTKEILSLIEAYVAPWSGLDKDQKPTIYFGGPVHIDHPLLVKKLYAQELVLPPPVVKPWSRRDFSDVGARVDLYESTPCTFIAPKGSTARLVCKGHWLYPKKISFKYVLDPYDIHPPGKGDEHWADVAIDLISDTGIRYCVGSFCHTYHQGMATMDLTYDIATFNRRFLSETTWKQIEWSVQNHHLTSVNMKWHGCSLDDVAV